MDWQTITAGAIVGFTVIIFATRLARPKKKKSGCGHHCGCDKPNEK